MKSNAASLLGSTAIAVLLASCGGGGSSGSAGAPPTAQPSTQPSFATVQFTVTVPATSTSQVQSRRSHPDFAAPSDTQSVSIVLASAGGVSQTPAPSTPFNLTGSACVTAQGVKTCTFSLQAPAGSDTFRVTMFPQPNAQGAPIGVGYVTVNAVAGQTVTAPTVLNGTIATLSLQLQQSAVVPEGVAATIPLVISAKDANGNVIIGTYSNPIALADVDSVSQTQLSATSIADSSSAASATLEYKGGVMNAAATITATAANVATPATVTFVPNTSYPTVNRTTLTYGTAEAGIFGGGTFGPSPPPNCVMLCQSPAVGTDLVTVTTGTTFAGQSGVIDVHTSRQYFGTSFDTYYVWSQNASSATLLKLGSAATNGGGLSSVADPTYPNLSGYSTVTTCAAPLAPAWIVPFPSSWDARAGSGPCTQTTTSNTTSDTRTQTEILNADGSYTQETTSSVSGTLGSIAADANGAVASYTWMTSGGTGIVTNSATVAFSTPAPGASTIPVQITNYNGPLPSPGATNTPAPVATSIPNWYAAAQVANSVASSPLVSDTYTNVGSVSSLPTVCNVPAVIVGTSPNYTEIDETFNAADPAGQYESEQYQYFLVSGVGVVCATEFMYMDYTNNVYNGYPGTGGEEQEIATYLTSSTLTAAMSAGASMPHAVSLASAGITSALHAREATFRARVQSAVRRHN